ncbi:hypothetical protein KPL70_016476 [Citrus sinensis]|nr:hypothetical protein KPL70_016476 [Citrus sinensis]
MIVLEDFSVCGISHAYKETEIMPKDEKVENFGHRARLKAAKNKQDRNTKLGFPSGENSSLPVAIFNGPEPFRGKSGSVSFCGLTHQLVEEGKLMSAPFQEDKGSFLWILAPVVLISSLILPQMFLGNVIEDFIKDNLLMEIVSSLTFESMFYVGLAIFLRITDRVQRPYLQFSPKRWGLITGLRGYLTSAFFTTGLKVVAPLFAVYVTWPVLRLPALVAVLPFLVGCAAQLAFETNLDKRGSSCWPLIPIIFEVYRLYQLSKAANFIERLMFSMKDLPRSPELLERGSAMVSMVVIFQVLGVGNASFAVDVVLMILRPRSFVLLGFVQLVLAELVLKQLPSLLDRS